MTLKRKKCCRIQNTIQAVLKCLSISESSCEACILENIVGWMWTQLKLGFSVACLMKDMVCLLGEGFTKSVDKGTCIIYSQGPERPTKMSGNKARGYFLTAVQTCIEKFGSSNKNETLSGWWQNLLGTIVWEFVHCVSLIWLTWYFSYSWKIFSIAEGLEASLSWRKHSYEPWLLTWLFPWQTQHSNCFLRLAMYVQFRRPRNRVQQVLIPLILQEKYYD